MVTYFFIWFMLYSFVGWLYESTLYTLMTGEPTNSGFLNGPFCPIYGFGSVMGILIFYGKSESIIQIFAISFIVEGTFEFVIGTILEVVFHKKWWDYSELSFNIKGRVCLLSCTVFGLLVILLVKVIHPFVEFISCALPERFISGIALVLIYVLVRDIIFTIAAMSDTNDSFKKYQKVCRRIKASDERLKNFIYKTLSTSKTLSNLMEQSKKFTAKMNKKEVSRDYVKLHKIDFSDLKERFIDYFK